MMDTDDTRHMTDHGQCQGYGISSSQGGKKSELDVTIRASLLVVGVLYLRFGTLYEDKIWYLTASENYLQKF